MRKYLLAWTQMNTLDTPTPPPFSVHLACLRPYSTAMDWTHPQPHQCSSKAIDGLFFTPGLLGHVSRYLSGLGGVTGYHHGLWIDLPE